MPHGFKTALPEAKHPARVPWFAIGGINADPITAVVAAGASGVAVVRTMAVPATLRPPRVDYRSSCAGVRQPSLEARRMCRVLGHSAVAVVATCVTDYARTLQTEARPLEGGRPRIPVVGSPRLNGIRVDGSAMGANSADQKRQALDERRGSGRPARVCTRRGVGAPRAFSGEPDPEEEA
jgi:Thiamine monophosphate synthase